MVNGSRVVPWVQERVSGYDRPGAVGSLYFPLPPEPVNGLAGFEDGGRNRGRSYGRGALPSSSWRLPRLGIEMGSRRGKGTEPLELEPPKREAFKVVCESPT
jgi:hypothetical protein